MITEEKIYHLASRDARAKSLPVREVGKGFQFSPGMKEILNDRSYAKNIIENLSENHQLKKDCKQQLTEMLSNGSIHEGDIKRNKEELEKIESEFEKKAIQLDDINEDIEEEETRLTNAGYNIPTHFRAKREQFGEMNESKETTNQFLNFFKTIDWKRLRKWFVVFLTIVTLEAFFGLALWDSLRDQKSIAQVALRIASSGLLVIILHLSELKYKKSRKWIYAVFIVYGIISLLALLLGSLILGYFFPEYLEVGNIVSDNVFDLSDNGETNPTVEKIGFIGFFIRYDFIIGILAVVIYMLISFLDTSKGTKKDEMEATELEEPQVRLAFTHLTNLYRKQYKIEASYQEAKREYEKLRDEPTNKMIVINSELKKMKKDVAEKLRKIEDNENSTNALLKNLETHMDKYKMIFLDVFNKTVSSSFAKPDWPEKEELLKYYQS